MQPIDNIPYWTQRLRTLAEETLNADADASNARNTVELDQTKVGRLSRMDALQAQAMNNAIASRRRSILKKVEAALSRLNEDEFGYCIRCGEEIELKRLDLDPAVSQCANCAKV